MGDRGVSKAGSTTKKRGGAKIYVLLALALVILVSVQTGIAGYGLAHLRSATFPQDEGLLEHVPATAPGVLIIDTHRLDPKALGPEDGAARTYLVRTREDIKKATGIDLWFDVDKIAIAPGIVVARGRFSHESLADKLKEHSYTEVEHKGVKILTRAGEDALAVVGGSILLYGDEASIRASIDAEAGDTSLGDQEPVTDRLEAVGWEHPVIGTVQINDKKPSVREILAGFTGPRAVTAGLTMKGGLTIEVAIESASTASAEELRKLLEEKRADAKALEGLVGSDLGPTLADVASRAKISVPAGSSQVAVQLDLTPEQLDRMVKAASPAAGPMSEVYKNLRLFQLLVPIP